MTKRLMVHYTVVRSMQ